MNFSSVRMRNLYMEFSLLRLLTFYQKIYLTIFWPVFFVKIEVFLTQKECFWHQLCNKIGQKFTKTCIGYCLHSRRVGGQWHPYKMWHDKGQKMIVKVISVLYYYVKACMLHVAWIKFWLLSFHIYTFVSPFIDFL